MLKVLIVEDSRTQAKSLKLMLESEGFAVTVASDGEEGFQKFSQSSFDLVISDIVMPSLSGYELCQKIKSSPQGKTVPVILLTALTELKDLIEGLRSGADNFITKPYERAYILNRIANVLANKHHGIEPNCDPDTGICFMNKSFIMNLDRRRILEYLVSTFDDFLRIRQQEHTSKLLEANNRIQLAQQQEQFLSTLAHKLQEPLLQDNQVLLLLLKGKYGKLEAEQHTIISQLQKNNNDLLAAIENLKTSFAKDSTVPVLTSHP